MTAARRLYRDGIAHVLPETAAQMICGALTGDEWSRAAGTAVGRMVLGDPYRDTGASCVIDSGTLTVTISTTAEHLGGDGERILGRRVRIAPVLPGYAVASAAMLPLAEQDVPTQQRAEAKPVLRLSVQPVNGQPINLFPDRLLRNLLQALLPQLTPEGRPVTPRPEPGATPAYVPAQPFAGVAIYDLPRPLHSAILCAATIRATRVSIRAEDVQANTVSECVIYRHRILAAITEYESMTADTTPYMINGHPAVEHGETILIRLLTLPTTRGGRQTLALRLEFPGPASTRHAWAQDVATTLRL